MESGKVDISRVNSHITYPADFQLIAAMNPCRCGYLGNPKKECRRAPVCGEEYQRRISGPIFDRIDIIINVEQIDPFDSTIFHKNDNSEDSASILARVVNARKFQQIRYQNHYKSSTNNSEASNCNSNANEHSLKEDFLYEDSFILNGRLSGELLNKFCFINPELTTVLQNISNKQQLSMRAINKILRVARTIADLEQSEDIAINHLLEAASYRYRGG
jgi:magnesium chelatase family protein